MSRNTQRLVLTRNFWLQVAETGLLISVNSSKPGLMLKLKLQYFGPWCEERTHRKHPDAERDWGREEKRATEGETVEESLACYSPWGPKEPDKTGSWTAKANQWGHSGVPWSLMPWDVELEIHSTLPLWSLLVSLCLSKHSFPPFLFANAPSNLIKHVRVLHTRLNSNSHLRVLLPTVQPIQIQGHLEVRCHKKGGG